MSRGSLRGFAYTGLLATFFNCLLRCLNLARSNDILELAPYIENDPEEVK